MDTLQAPNPQVVTRCSTHNCVLEREKRVVWMVRLVWLCMALTVNIGLTADIGLITVEMSGLIVAVWFDFSRHDSFDCLTLHLVRLILNDNWMTRGCSTTSCRVDQCWQLNDRRRCSTTSCQVDLEWQLHDMRRCTTGWHEGMLNDILSGWSWMTTEWLEDT